MASIKDKINELNKAIEKDTNEFKSLNASLRDTSKRLKIYNFTLNGSMSGLRDMQATSATLVRLRKNEMTLQRLMVDQTKKLLVEDSKKLKETRQQIVEQQKQIEELRKSTADKRAARQAVVDSLKTLKEEDDKRKKYIDLLKERLAAGYEDVRYTRSQIAAVADERKATETNIALLNEKEQAQRSLIDAIRKQVKDITKGKSPDQLKRLSGEEKSNLRTLQKREAEAAQELEVTIAKQKEENKLKESLAKTETELVKDLNRLNGVHKSLADTIVSERTERQKIANSTSEYNSALGKLNSYLDSVRNGKTALEEQKKAMKSAIDAWVAANVDEIQLKINVMRQYKARLNEITEPLKKLYESIRNVQQTFGIVAGQAVSLGLADLGNVVKTTINVLRSFGKSGPTVSMEQIMGAREAFQEEFGGLLTSDAATEFAQQAVSMGVTAKQLAQARRVFMTQTMGNANEAKRVQDRFISEFAKKGLTAKDAMAAIAQNSELLARNGTRFATAFTRAAADAKKIGIDLNKISQVGDNIINDFEGFLESQAELGAMGFGFDTSRLAQIAAIGDDAALFRELQSQLAATGKDITRLSRPERLSLESAFGLNLSEMMRMASGAGSGETLEEITKNSNSLLDSAVNLLGGVVGSLVITNGLLSALVLLQRANQLRYSVGGALMKQFGGMGGLGMGALGAVGGLALGAGIGTAMGASPMRTAIGSILGTAIGAAIGSFFGPPGTYTGAYIGAAIGGGLGGAIAGLTAKSQGGLITGPGSGTSDSILTRLSNGEYVMRADAVRTIGVDRLDALNKIPGKALGGLIGTVASKSGLLSGLMTKYAKFGMPDTERSSGLFSGVQSLKEKFAKYTSSEGLMNLVSSKMPRVGGLMEKASGLMGGGLGGLMTKGTDMLSKKVPGVSGLMSAFSAYKEGGMKGALGSLAQGGIGKAIGGAIGTAIPIPFVGTAVGSLLGSKIGKFAGGLFGGKKSAGDMMASVAKTMVPKIPGMERFAPTLEALGAGAAAPSTATPPLVAEQKSGTSGKGNEDLIGRAVAAAIANALQGVHVKMDGTSVGKILVNTSEAANTLGVFRQTSRATI